jgi:SAM-dependent methyltransferase
MTQPTAITGNTGMDTPSPWVARFAPLIAPGGAVLDVAAGGGRHARFMVKRGHPVTAVDRDSAALAQEPGVTVVQADLEDGSPWPLGDRKFAGIVVTNYLHRPLFPVLVHSLAPGGVLIYETFALGNEQFGRPRNPDFLLKSGELLAAFASLTVVAYEHGRVESPRPSAVQRICAQAEPATLNTLGGV